MGHDLPVENHYTLDFFLTCSDSQWDGFAEFKTFIFVERKRDRLRVVFGAKCQFSKNLMEDQLIGSLVLIDITDMWLLSKTSSEKREKLIIVVSKLDTVPLQIFLFPLSHFLHANSEQTPYFLPSKVQKKSDIPLNLPSFQCSFYNSDEWLYFLFIYLIVNVLGNHEPSWIT